MTRIVTRIVARIVTRNIVGRELCDNFERKPPPGAVTRNPCQGLLGANPDAGTDEFVSQFVSPLRAVWACPLGRAPERKSG